MASTIGFSEDETFKIMWSLLEAVELAKQVDMLSTMALLDGTDQMVRRGCEMNGRASVKKVQTNDRVSVPEAVRQTGVPGDRILRAIFDDEISTDLSERGIDRVLVDEVMTLRDEAS